MNKRNIIHLVIICVVAVVVVFLSKFYDKKNDEVKPSEQLPDIVDAEFIETSEVQNEKLKDKVICIDPGHGITSRAEQEPIYPGAKDKKPANVSGTSGKLATEEELNLEVGLKLKSELEKKGAIVHITRTTHESDMSNVERAEFSNKNNCDMVVRIHGDGSESSSVSGISMLVPSSKYMVNGYLTEEIVQKSRKAGEFILNDVCQNTGASNNGIKEREDMTGFNWSAVPVVLLEMGFLTNPKEEEMLVNAEYQQKIVTGIITGLEKYFSE